MKKIVLIIAMAGGIIIDCKAQVTAPDLLLSLEDAVNHAVEFNKSLQNARFEVEKSRRNIWESIAQGLPQVEGSLDYLTYFNYELEFEFGGDIFTPTADQIQDAMDATLSNPAFTGTTQQDLWNHQAGNYMDGQLQAMAPPTTILMSDQSTATLQLSQLIFNGQYIVGIQTARLAQKISEQNLEFSELDIKEAVIGAYYLVLISEESLRILEQNVANLRETLRQTEKMYSAGMTEKTDVDQIRITVNQLENARNSMRRSVELNYNMLRFQLGLETSGVFVLTDNLEGLFSEIQPDEILRTPFTLESNINYQIMKTQEEINKKLVELEQWNYAPTIAGFYNYNAKLLTTGFDMNPNHLAGLSFSIPIFTSGMRKAKIDQARIQYEMTQTSRKMLEDQLMLQDKQYRFNLQSALENYQTQKENVQVALEVYNSYLLKFKQGMASSLDLTNANNNYLNAESNYITAIMDVMQAKLQMDKLMNKL